MPIAPLEGYHEDDPLTPPVFPALRELLSKYPRADFAPETLTVLLHELGYVPLPPETHEVEAALEALRIEGAVLA